MSREDQTEATKLNLDTYVAPHDLTLRPTETPEDAAHRRWRDKILFVVAVLFTSAIFIAALAAFFRGDPDQRTWAASALSLILGSLVGYLTGKNTT